MVYSVPGNVSTYFINAVHFLYYILNRLILCGQVLSNGLKWVIKCELTSPTCS